MLLAAVALFIVMMDDIGRRLLMRLAICSCSSGEMSSEAENILAAASRDC